MPAIKYKKKTYAGSTFPVLEMTKAQYDVLPDSKKMDGTVYLITDDTGGWEAENSIYDNTTSGMTATNVQDALDELNSNKADNNISGTGYCKMPDGTLIQWGSNSNVKSGDVIAFPFEFATSSGLRVFIQPTYNTYTTIQCNFVHSDLKKGSFTAYAYNTETKALSTSTTLQFEWFAIGRWK